MASRGWKLFWAGALACVASTAQAAPPAASSPKGGGAAKDAHCRPGATLLDLRPRTEPEWFGLYLGDKKVGWLRTRSGTERRDGREVRVFREEMRVEARVGDRAVVREAVEERVYEPGARGKLLSLTSEFRGDGGNRELRVTCVASGCRAELSASGGKRSLEFPHPGETAEQADATRLAALTCGTVTGSQLQADDLRVKRAVTRYAGRSRLGAGGVEVPVSVVEEKEEGDRVATRALVSDDGRHLESRVGEGMVVKLEPAETAKRLDVIDLFTTVRVPLPSPLPRDVPMSITYALRGLPRGFDLQDGRQRAVAGQDGETLVTVTARPFPGPDEPRGKPEPRGDPDQAATIEIDWENPAIRAQAAAIAGETRGTWETARKLNRAVYQRLEKVYGQSSDRASDILREGRGDCTEHTRLFVALARASGIRAREVKGLVYASYGSGGPALYWHAWPEVKVGGDWVAVDPTFGQEVADATHVALGRGTRQDAIALVGSLKVVRTETRKP